MVSVRAGAGGGLRSATGPHAVRRRSRIGCKTAGFALERAPWGGSIVGLAAAAGRFLACSIFPVSSPKWVRFLGSGDLSFGGFVHDRRSFPCPPGFAVGLLAAARSGRASCSLRQ